MGVVCKRVWEVLESGPMVHSLPQIQLIVTGGISINESEEYKLSSAEEFNLGTSHWTGFQDLPYPLAYHQQIDLGTPIIYGGQSGQEDALESSNEIIDFQSGNWVEETFKIPQLLRHHS